MIRRIVALAHARNLEFVRDRSALGWNILLPILLVIGLSMVFSDADKPLFRVAVLAAPDVALNADLHPFLETRHILFYRVDSSQGQSDKVARHQVDMLLDLRAGESSYQVNDESPKGYLLERLLGSTFSAGNRTGHAAEQAATSSASGARVALTREAVSGDALRYVDWLIPGILGMNIMFSCLFGVGYVIVRYRKSGYLKRLNATPVRAIEFIVAQVLSRLVLIMLVTAFVYIGTDLFLDFRMQGRYLDLLLLTTLGAVSMIALGLLVSARVANEELAGGLLNFLSWPMMLLSGVWFSLEGSSDWLHRVADLFPLTHLLDGARRIMHDGATLWDVRDEVAILVGMAAFFMLAGAAMFRWAQE